MITLMFEFTSGNCEGLSIAEGKSRLLEYAANTLII
jgi:hypothetical protein